ncbi:unnamed protein product [Paramecium octaurelia]|uniref:Transmembrane protein n=1 Tax=Paramecium octaurelia TaxID=43137 RepID=A0A8S1YAP1_PAROT|nr:unnamed protein product [Paramecium octaurelia]
MNKYTLKFRDKKIEEQFQKIHQIPTRQKHIKLISVFFLALQIFKLIASILQHQKEQMYILIFLIATTLVLCFAKITSSFSSNMALCFINLSFTFYTVYYDPKDEITNSYYRGANQMVFNIINILLTDFLESAFITMIIFATRSIHVILYGDKPDISYFVLGFIINLSFLYIIYTYRSAMRSQYILSRTDKQWENILKQIIHDEQFLLINFDVEKLKFSKILSNFFRDEQRNDQIGDFLRNSYINQETLENYLFNQIKLFQTNYHDVFNKIISLKYEKYHLSVTYSIFQGSRPTILIQLVKTQYNKEIQSLIIKTLINLKLLTNLIRIINGNQTYSKDKFQKIATILIYQYFQAKLHSKRFSFKICNLKNIILDLKYYFYPNSMVRLLENNVHIKTISCILKLLLLIIVESSISRVMFIKTKGMQNQLKIHSTFNVQIFKVRYLQFEYFLQAIVKSISSDEKSIEFELHQESFLPYCRPMSIKGCYYDSKRNGFD